MSNLYMYTMHKIKTKVRIKAKIKTKMNRFTTSEYIQLTKMFILNRKAIEKVLKLGRGGRFKIKIFCLLLKSCGEG